VWLALPGTPLARDFSVGRPARGVVTRLSSAVRMGHTISAARGVLPFRRLWSRVVSVAEVDKQRVALGPAGEESVDTLGSLVLQCASIREAKERWKPVRRWLSREHGGGFLREHLSMEGTPGLENRLF
jgi:hypothetical protein